ncbi:hypothetical protein Trydic_g1730 [Trypoxylus dichotomus]
MELILAENGVSEYIKKETNKNLLTGEERKVVDKEDNKAKSLIVQCVKDTHLESLRCKETAFSMWKTLEENYEKKGLPSQLYLKKEDVINEIKRRCDAYLLHSSSRRSTRTDTVSHLQTQAMMNTVTLSSLKRLMPAKPY